MATGASACASATPPPRQIENTHPFSHATNRLRQRLFITHNDAASLDHRAGGRLLAVGVGGSLNAGVGLLVAGSRLLEVDSKLVAAGGGLLVAGGWLVGTVAGGRVGALGLKRMLKSCTIFLAPSLVAAIWTTS